MAEFVPVDGGGHKSSSPSKKKKQQMMLMAGGVVVVLILVMMSKKGSGTQDVTYAVAPSPDATQRLDNFSSIMTEQTNAAINSSMNEMNSAWTLQFKEINDGFTTQMKEMRESQKEMFEQQQQWVKDSMEHLKNSTGNGSIRNEADPLWTIGSSSASFNQEKYDSDLAKLQEDRGALRTELQRAHSVLQWRQNNGMDTTAQENYIKQLNGM